MALRKSSEIALMITDNISVVLAYWDHDQVCRFANNACVGWFGKTKGEIVDKWVIEDLFGLEYPKVVAHIQGVMAGEKQVFESRIVLPSGQSAYGLVTFSPDIIEGKTIGFFHQIADITPIRESEKDQGLLHQTRRKELLGSVIESADKERESIANELRDHVSQTLAYCKWMLQYAKNEKSDQDYLQEITGLIHQALDELGILNRNLSSSIVTDVGFKEGVEDYIDNIRIGRPVKIKFECAKEIELLEPGDKLSVFRIIQNCLLILTNSSFTDLINIEVDCRPPAFELRFGHNDFEFETARNSKEFLDLAHRVEYYGGSFTEVREEEQVILVVEIEVDK